ncbi:MAG: LysM peptidoglycan-binding domain-containing protein, partial [Clostridia bacterium]|nr:LysM peptidoglycan-binding domain-containing protein [Clostridia bacterium]
PITGQYYWVVPGDSLWRIGQRFGINYLTLAQVNNINVNAPLITGTRLYIPPRPKTSAEVNAYIEPFGATVSEPLLNDAAKAAPYLTYIAPFSYRAGSNGTLSPLPLNGIPEIAANNNASLMMVITNLTAAGFSGQIARDILTSVAVQEQLITNILAEAQRVGIFSDIHFDFEFIPIDLKEEYTAFLRRAAARLRPNGYLISAALAPKTSATQPGQWYEAHDYGAIAREVDFVVIMTYEWGYSGGPPMPVSPIVPVERVLQYALTEMPASKILMGQNLYGYDWTLPYIAGGPFARAISPQTAIEIAKNNGVAIQYDYTAQAPFFNYTINGIRHIVWFEDARSIQAKFDLLKRLNLRGISYWKLGLSFPQNWLLIGDNFNVVKRQS